MDERGTSEKSTWACAVQAVYGMKVRHPHYAAYLGACLAPLRKAAGSSPGQRHGPPWRHVWERLLGAALGDLGLGARGPCVLAL